MGRISVIATRWYAQGAIKVTKFNSCFGLVCVAARKSISIALAHSRRLSHLFKAASFTVFAIIFSFAFPLALLGQDTFPNGPGQAVATRMCSQCHGLNVITPLRMDHDRWAAKVNDMVSRGAQGSDADIATVIQYLSSHYPKGAGPASQTASVAAAPSPSSNSSDVPAQSMVSDSSGDAGASVQLSKVVSGVTNDRILNADKEPSNWLTFAGTYRSNHYSQFKQITPENVNNMELKWVYQPRSLEIFETTPLVVDGVLYTSEGGGGEVVALDARTGRLFWIYRHVVSNDVRGCCGRVSRGLAILGETLYVGAVDNHLIALDAKTGKPLWDRQIADAKAGYSLTCAPLIVKDKVIVGISGGEYGIRGFIAAYDAFTGKEVWRFHTVPEPGEPGHETWGGDTWVHGGSSAWLTGSYDPEANLLYWGVGNPGPDYNSDLRPGDNLYSCSMLALDPDTGKLKWYYQANPHNENDWDAVETPVLVDMNWQGKPRKVLLWGDRNGIFYVLDRITGQFLLGKEFMNQNWNAGFDEKGRPILTPNASSSPDGSTVTSPDNQGATNWDAPSYSPLTGLFYLNARENYTEKFLKGPEDYDEGNTYEGRGRAAKPPPPPVIGTNEDKYIAIRALDPATGERKWEYRLNGGVDLGTFSNWSTLTGASGLLTTASNVLFAGERQGNFFALDARTGALLWKVRLGGDIMMDLMTYSVDNKQYVAVNAGTSLFVFGLRD
jgi:alcohol dehydrogenase (cytochrome c)